MPCGDWEKGYIHTYVHVMIWTLEHTLPPLLSSHLMVDSLIQLGLIHVYHIPLVNSSDQQKGQTPVYIASQQGHGTVVQMLIEANADIMSTIIIYCMGMCV